MSLNPRDRAAMVAASNHKAARKLILARFEPTFLKELMKRSYNKAQGRYGISQMQLAKECDLGARSIANYLSGDSKPDREALEKLGEYFGVHFVIDYNKSINMDALLETLKALSHLKE